MKAFIFNNITFRYTSQRIIIFSLFPTIYEKNLSARLDGSIGNMIEYTGDMEVRSFFYA